MSGFTTTLGGFPISTSTSNFDASFNDAQDNFDKQYEKASSVISTGQKVGIGIGVTFAVCVVVFGVTVAVIVLRRRRRRRIQMEEYNQPNTHNNPEVGHETEVKPELGGGNNLATEGQMPPVYSHQQPQLYRGPVEVQQTGVAQRELGGEPMRRELGDARKEGAQKDLVEMP